MRFVLIGLAGAAGAIAAATAFAQNPPPHITEIPSNGAAVTTIDGSANGRGNTINIENGSADDGSVNIISNSRNGVGNRINIHNPGGSIILNDETAPPADPRVTASDVLGKEVFTWTATRWHPEWKCWIYWCPKEWTWHRYHADSQKFYPWFAYPSR